MMAMKIRTTRPVDRRLEEISWLRLLTGAVEDELTGRTSHLVGARTAAVEVPALTSLSSIASEVTALAINWVGRPAAGKSVRSVKTRSRLVASRSTISSAANLPPSRSFWADESRSEEETSELQSRHY